MSKKQRQRMTAIAIRSTALVGLTAQRHPDEPEWLPKGGLRAASPVAAHRGGPGAGSAARASAVPGLPPDAVAPSVPAPLAPPVLAPGSALSAATRAPWCPLVPVRFHSTCPPLPVAADSRFARRASHARAPARAAASTLHMVSGDLSVGATPRIPTKRQRSRVDRILAKDRYLILDRDPLYTREFRRR